MAGTRPALKEAIADADQIEQFLANADAFLRFADAIESAPVVQYTNAYEGIFAIAMGLLRAYGVRTNDGPGHRAVALQILINHVWPGDPGVYKTLMDAHGVRNLSTYEQPRPTVTIAQAKALVGLLARGLPKIRTLISAGF